MHSYKHKLNDDVDNAEDKDEEDLAERASIYAFLREQ